MEWELRPYLWGFKMTRLAMLIHMAVEIVKGFSGKFADFRKGRKGSILLLRIAEDIGVLLMDINLHQILRKMKSVGGSSGIVMVMGLQEMGCKRNWKEELNS